MADAFLDTNILVYLLSDEVEKATISQRLLAERGAISVQVLNEFVAVALRKNAADWDEIEMLLAGFRRAFRVEPLTTDTQSHAVALARRYRLAIYDATILAAAKQAGCERLYSEDMQHGQIIDGVRIENPFI